MKPLGMRKDHRFDGVQVKATRGREHQRNQRLELAANEDRWPEWYYPDPEDDFDYEAMEEAVIGLLFALGDGRELERCDACAANKPGACPKCFGFGVLGDRLPTEAFDP